MLQAARFRGRQLLLLARWLRDGSRFPAEQFADAAEEGYRPLGGDIGEQVSARWENSDSPPPEENGGRQTSGDIRAGGLGVATSEAAWPRSEVEEVRKFILKPQRTFLLKDLHKETILSNPEKGRFYGVQDKLRCKA